MPCRHATAQLRHMLTGLLVWRCRTRQKPNMEVVLMKSPQFDDIIAQENVPGRAPGADVEDAAAQLQGAALPLQADVIALV